MEWYRVLSIIYLATLASSYTSNSILDLQSIQQHTEPTSNICLTRECVHAASGILLSLDESVDPCHDFYRFSCGGWLDRHTIPEDKVEVSTFSELSDDLKLKLRILLEKELDGTEPAHITKIKDLYDTCMDLDKIEKVGAEPLNKILKNLGGWPVVEGSKWDDSKFDWVDALIGFRKFGYSHNILLGLYVGADYRNNTVHTIDLDQTLLGMPDRTYLLRGLHDPATAAYYQLMVKSAKLLGADEATAEKELLKALHFEIALANYTLPPEEMLDVSKLLNEYTVKQLEEIIPQIPWLKYLKGLLKTDIYENDIVVISVPEFVKNFADLITKTEKRVVANYMLWRLISQSLSDLSKEFRSIEHEYNSVYGASKEEPRWKQCISSVNGNMGIALSSYYVRHYFNEDSKDAAVDLVNYVYEEFLRILDEIDWMDEQTKKQAIAKALSIKTYIGYPKELLNNTAVAELYENLTITNKSYFDNIRRLDKWLTDEVFSKLRKLNIREKWDNHADAAIVNAFYSLIENSIEFPAGILQLTFFNKDRPYYLNFGRLGNIFGHEITHGFDNSGRQFDKDGNVVNWWDKNTDKLFTEKAQCMVEQYSNYVAENGMRLNGITTLGENIADNGGLKEAYWAYQSWVKENGEEKLLPGLNYSQNQLFWISVANGWCSKQRPESIQLTILTDSHSLEEFRVIGPVSNLEEFSKDFNCSPDSPMNKRQKCTVW